MAQIEIPVLNSEYLFPRNYTQPAKYNTKEWGLVQWQESLRDYQKYNKFKSITPKYFQKKELTDHVSIQITVPADYTSATLSIASCSGIADTGATTTTETVGGDLDDDGNQQTRVQFDLDLIGFIAGQYAWYVEIELFDGSIQVLDGAPMDFKANHPETKLIEYFSNENKDDIIWSMNPRFSYRVNCNTEFNRNSYDRVTFLNQNANLTQVYINNYQVWDFEVGFPDGGISDYDLDKIQNIFKCDVTTIDGIAYLMAQEAEWVKEPYGSNRYPLGNAKIEIVKSKQTNSRVVNLNTVIELFDTGAARGFPYVVNFLTFYGPGSPGAPVVNMQVPFVNQIAEVLNGTDEDNMIATWNTYAASQGVIGTIQKVGTKIVFNRDYRETYTVTIKQQLFPSLRPAFTAVDATTKTIDITTAQPTLLGTIVSLRTSAGAIFSDAHYLPFDSTVFYSETFDVGTAYDDYVLRAYFIDNQTEVYITGSNHNITAVDGAFPESTQISSVKQGDIPVYDPSTYLQRCANNVVTVISQNMKHTSLASTPFTPLSGAYLKWKNVDLSNNLLGTTTGQDRLYNRYANDLAIPNGLFGGNIDSRFNSASPTAASAGARTFLTTIRLYSISF